MPWLSGVYPEPRMEPVHADDFGSWRGRPVDIALLYTTRNQGWDHIVGPQSFIWKNFRGWPGRLAISVPPWPENIGGSYAACASGAYDSQWRRFGQTLRDQGRADSIVRIAWEANGNWFQWSANNADLFRQCFRKIAASIRSTNPDVVIDLTFNAHYSHNPPGNDPRDLYPGDEWVDVIGVDAFDFYPPSRTQAEWDAQCHGMGGLCWWVEFARQHGKKFSVGEWGVVSAPNKGPNAGGDNPFYIERMYDFFVQNRDILLYEAYFSERDEHNVRSDIWRVPQNPAAASVYRELW